MPAGIAVEVDEAEAVVVVVVVVVVRWCPPPQPASTVAAMSVSVSGRSTRAAIGRGTGIAAGSYIVSPPRGGDNGVDDSGDTT